MSDIIDLIDTVITLYCNTAVLHENVRQSILKYYKSITKHYKITGVVHKQPLPVQFGNPVTELLLIKCNAAINLLWFKHFANHNVRPEIVEALQQRMCVLNNHSNVAQIRQEYEKRCKNNDVLYAMDIILFWGQFVNPRESENKILISAAYAGNIDIVRMYIHFIKVDSMALLNIKRIAAITGNPKLCSVVNISSN